jgi:hypothetical protein
LKTDFQKTTKQFDTCIGFNTYIMVSPRSLLAASFALCASFVQAAPAATSTAAAPLCTPEHQGIIQPASGATITQVKNDNGDGTTVQIVYCSGQYFKTSSIDASVFLTAPDSPDSGELLAKDVKPDNQDASAGFYSYRFNVTISPADGDYQTGPYVLSIYETETGELMRIDVNEKTNQ